MVCALYAVKCFNEYWISHKFHLSLPSHQSCDYSLLLLIIISLVTIQYYTYEILLVCVFFSSGAPLYLNVKYLCFRPQVSAWQDAGGWAVSGESFVVLAPPPRMFSVAKKKTGNIHTFEVYFQACIILFQVFFTFLALSYVPIIAIYAF